jgi:hypothetical protein
MPYVSDFFKKTIRDYAIPVVGTKAALELGLHAGTNIITETQAVEMVQDDGSLKVYSTSENSIAWISKNLAFSELPEKINLFKNKSRFRALTKSMNPDFFYQEIGIEDLSKLEFDQLPLPFVIKPTVGFFSMGVHVVSCLQDWNLTINTIFSEIDQIKTAYPDDVVGTESFIIEQFIEGDEFAVDAYFNAQGEPVVLGIMKHLFSSEDDVGDRVYITSAEIIQENLEEFTEFTGKIGALSGIKNFPVHIELRRTDQGVLLPIEVNPMRFGGWCTTADVTFLAYGINPYLLYFQQGVPLWEEVLRGKEGKIFSIIVLNNSTGLQADEIASFDYRKLLSGFEDPLELRELDINRYPVFGFLFTETRKENFAELQRILESDLHEFISRKQSTP